MGEGGATYAGAGVDIAAGDEAVERMRSLVQGIGGFGGQFPLDMSRYRAPVLVASTDGVGTKMVVARDTGRYDTVGIDLVAMCVDDLVCVGAEPLFMLDYIATGKVDPDQVATVVAGVREGCNQAGCALIGGETAEHAGVMPPDELDLAGFAVGVVEQGTQLGPERVRAGDAVVALAVAGTAVQRLHARPARALGAGRPGVGRPRLGGGRAQRGRRAAAAVGRSTRRRCWPCGTRSVRRSMRVRTSREAASWATCPGCCPRTSARCSLVLRGRSRGCSRRFSGSVPWPRTKWTASSTAASAWRWWSTPVRSSRRCRCWATRGRPGAVIGEVVAGSGVRFT